MKNEIKYIFIGLIMVLFSACKKEYTTYDGQTVVEFIPAVNSKSQGTVAAPGSDNAKVQLVGAQRTADLELTYTVDASSTAVEGVHYSLPNKGKFTLPANSSFGYIKINLIPGSIPNNTTTSQKKLVLKLAGNADVPASANYKTYTLTITF
ncbi:hypothetical protein GM921_12185 [Pedobacter sp. LMG 31464]|uniref:DUF1735 domain-containing protein n=1 Tax=Pedobacter planticolens TaxID=2679964 RepID=A0A923IUR7_9SPHI|nr:hypothetical protein [Pedobacter planticolens]MBB2146250.1 hypothetical protein [Pedobacter planticolens]